MDVLQKNIWEDIHVIPGSDGHNSPKLETVQMPFKSRMKKIVVDLRRYAKQDIIRKLKSVNISLHAWISLTHIVLST